MTNTIDVSAEAVEGEREQFAWLIEAPGPSYLAAHEGVGHVHEFRWTREATEALRFYSQKQADAAMMAVRQLDPRLWGFAAVLGEARPVEHAWIATAILAALRLAESHPSAIREAVEGEREACAKWHDQRARDTPDAFEMEFHQVSAAAIRARGE